MILFIEGLESISHNLNSFVSNLRNSIANAFSKDHIFSIAEINYSNCSTHVLLLSSISRESNERSASEAEGKNLTKVSMCRDNAKLKWYVLVTCVLNGS